MTFIFAGHETTANARSRGRLYSSLSPQFLDSPMRVSRKKWLKRTDSGELAYTRMVLEESMRLYPSSADYQPRPVGADVVGGVAIRPGTSIMISPWVLHRHRTLWDDPDYFDPERFCAGSPRRRYRASAISRSARGPRICIGMGVSMQEALIILCRDS